MLSKIKVIITDEAGNVKFDSCLRSDYSFLHSMLRNFGSNSLASQHTNSDLFGLNKKEREQIKSLLSDNPEYSILLQAEDAATGVWYEVSLRNYKDLKKILPNTEQEIKSHIVPSKREQKLNKIEELNKALNSEPYIDLESLRKNNTGEKRVRFTTPNPLDKVSPPPLRRN